jgi:hypothetical protein
VSRARVALRARALGLGVALVGSGCVAVVGGAVAGGAAGTAASVAESREGDHSKFTYVETVAANVVYVPAKVVFALVGATASGLSYVGTLGNVDLAESIWTASVGGDYVVTPTVIDGHDTVEFLGREDPVADAHRSVPRRPGSTRPSP